VRLRRALVLVLAVLVAFSKPVWGVDDCAVKAAIPQSPTSPVNTDLLLAKEFASLGDWKDAEAHFANAAKDPNSQKEALACIDMARTKVDAARLRAGQLFESGHQWSKAEELYRTAIADPATSSETREVFGERLKASLETEHREDLWTTGSEWVKDGVETVVFILAVILFLATVGSIYKSRKRILIHPFTAPSDELAKGLNNYFRYARSMMQNPALSPAGQVPAVLVEDLLTFDDEIEPIEDLEIAGSKVPFASLSRLFGRPLIRVTGGFDGVEPLGNAYSVVKTHDGSADAFVNHTIHMGVPSVQRRDLVNFAYDVLVKASSAHVLL
jgi:hypothetical protein